MVSGGQALLSFKNSKLLVQQTAQARRDEATRSEVEWNRANRATHVAAIEAGVESNVRSICQIFEWMHEERWSKEETAGDVADELLSHLRAVSAAGNLDPSGQLVASVQALYDLSRDVEISFVAEDKEETCRLYDTLIAAASAVTDSLAATRAR